MQNKQFPLLYSRTKTGAIQTWSIYVEGFKFKTSYGHVDGKVQHTQWTECNATNIGKKNERTPEMQALFEAESIWKKKKESGFYEKVEDIDSLTFEPMLAKNFEDYKDELKYPLFSQPKLDGIRCIINKQGMFS
jgi:hypothetical protein